MWANRRRENAKAEVFIRQTFKQITVQVCDRLSNWSRDQSNYCLAVSWWNCPTTARPQPSNLPMSGEDVSSTWPPHPAPPEDCSKAERVFSLCLSVSSASEELLSLVSINSTAALGHREQLCSSGVPRHPPFHLSARVPEAPSRSQTRSSINQYLCRAVLVNRTGLWNAAWSRLMFLQSVQEWDGALSFTYFQSFGQFASNWSVVIFQSNNLLFFSFITEILSNTRRSRNPWTLTSHNVAIATALSQQKCEQKNEICCNISILYKIWYNN